MIIERHWKGIAKKDRAQEYILHLRNETFKQLEQIDGFIDARILRRETSAGVEFLIITSWSSFDAIRQFAGPNFEKAVVPQLVLELMITCDHEVAHYESLD